MKNRFFYRGIYKKDKGYQLVHKNEHYGWYPDLPTALFDRDRLEQCGWDMEVFVQLPEIPNPYLYMELPEYHHEPEYIVYLPAKWRVQKKVNGRMCYYGTFDSYEEAEKRRNDLIKKGLM